MSLLAKACLKLEIKAAEMASELRQSCLILKNDYFEALKTNAYPISGSMVFKSI